MNKRSKIGDICEIATANGLSYVQYTHDDEDMGQLVRVLPGAFPSRPEDFADLAKKKELYFVFYTLNHAIRTKQAKIVSNQPIPEWARPFPMMRHVGRQEADGTVKTWTIYPAGEHPTVESLQKMPKFTELTSQQEKLSIHSLWSHEAMVYKLSIGWTPERAEELRLKAIAEEAMSGKSKLTSEAQAMRHYLYFAKKGDAETAAERLRDRGFAVQVRKGADGKNWLAFATHTPPTDDDQMEQLRDELESLAAELSGEYDGWELAVETAPSLRPN